MYIKQIGQGQDLFLLHGWRMNLNCWKPLIEVLTSLETKPYRITAVDLPGHGRSIGGNYSLTQIETLTAHLLEIAPRDAIWIGWSLGGLLAQIAATHDPQHIRSLVSVCMSCKYIAAPDWQYGIEAQYFNEMRRQLDDDPTDCINRFINSQILNSEHKAATLNALEALCAIPCDLEELKAGLDLLKTIDLREHLQTWPGRALFIGGEYDVVCPQLALEQSAKLCHNGSYISLSNAGHAPLLSHPQHLAQIIETFCDE